MQITVINNPSVVRKEFSDISIVDVDQAFKSFTSYFQSHFDDRFVMVHNQLGRMYNDQGETVLLVYIHDADHNGINELIIVTRDDEIQSEVESITPLWHNLIVTQ